MNPLRPIIAALGRVRTGKGFGVHSPFAYTFIVRAIRESAAYYAYPDIDCAASRPGADLSRSSARLLHRVANHLTPSEIILVGRHDSAAAVALMPLCATSPLSIVTPEQLQTMTIPTGALIAVVLRRFDPKSLAPKLINALTDSEASVVIAHTRRNKPGLMLLAAIETSMTRGMTFAGRNMAIVVGRAALPRQRFTLRFP